MAAPVPAAFGRIVHGCVAMRRQVDLAQRMAAHDVPVLILGETGTGKELFAEALHAYSARAQGPFIAVNCGAIPHDLANAELFGHVKGAFTGAASARKGHFREAEGGTLFLDEVGDLPLETQARLLRVLQQREVTPLGASRPVKVNVRVVAATHRNLMAAVAAGRFREDLFHRLAVGILHLPPLRERGDDAALLIDHFMAAINADARDRPEAQEKKLSPSAKNLLLAHRWPGNVRELYHTLVRAAIWSAESVVQAQDVRAALLPLHMPAAIESSATPGQTVDLQALLDTIAREHITAALALSGGRKRMAAAQLGFANYQTLGNWMKRLGIEAESPVN
jgi:DNA-binding NtrC family response regulator